MDCIFCKIVAGEIPSHKVYEDDSALAFLDIAPSSRGHTLVVPRVHAQSLYDISAHSLAATTAATQAVAHILRSKLQPDGLNVFQNNGAAAGQEVFHYHVHLVPRRAGERTSLGGRGATDHAALAALAAELRQS